MATADLECAGCLGKIGSSLYVACSLCCHLYDLDCANITEETFRSDIFTKHKKEWECVQCKSKRPKIANTNTPVRDMFATSTGTTGESSAIFSSLLDESNAGGRYVNVRMRGNPLTQDSCIFGENSYAEDSVGLDNIRTIVREELEHVVDERLAKLISSIIMEKVAVSIQEACGDLPMRVSALEKTVASLVNRIEEKQQLSQTVVDMNPAPIRRVKKVKAGTKLKPVTNQEKSRLKSATLNNQQEKASDSAPPCNKPQDIPGPCILEVSKPANDNASIAASDGEWTVVRRSRHSSLGVMRGTAAPGVTQLEACERWRYLHLYFVKEGTTEDLVSSHLKSISGTDVCTVEALKARGHYASFKLGVPSKLADKVMLPENWPADVCIKPWKQNFRASNPEKQRSIKH